MIDELNKFQDNKVVNLTGYTSTSLSKETACHFALKKDVPAGKVPIVFQIEFHSKNGLFMLSQEYTAYPGENEVLI